MISTVFWELKNCPLTLLSGHLAMWNDQWCQSHSQTEWRCTASSQCSDSWRLHTGRGELGRWWSVPREREPRHSSLYWCSWGGRDRRQSQAGRVGRGCWHSLQSNVFISKINMSAHSYTNLLKGFTSNYCKCITFGDVFFLAALAVISIHQIKYIAKCASI